MKDYKTTRDLLKQGKSYVKLQIVEKRDRLAREELRFRILEDNTILRNKIALEKKLEVDIQILREQVGHYDCRQVQVEGSLLLAQQDDLKKQLNHLLGERSAIMNMVRELQEELDEPNNRDAVSGYTSTYYQLKVTEVLVYDLRKYIDAFETAVLDFHKDMLKEINENLKELWTNIYRGNDIDYIAIRYVLPTVIKKKQQHIYKIVQIRNNCEQDMRKRGSASQKIIASLIIRLALAETLGVNCGIFAIDEPTTNLDKEHIQSLCDTLSRIIQIKRRKEKTFQLLVITHDEEFLSALMKSQDVSYFYRVTRDKDGFCIINEENSL